MYVLFRVTRSQDVGIIVNDNESIYSRFSNRIMFPIKTHSGKTIGFSGRKIKEAKTGKYINSPATKLFEKSRLLFGYDLAKEFIYKKETMVLVEGQLDVIMLHQIGIKTAVATLGTALTEQHLPLIKKSCKRVLVAYDGDKAGRAAALKASKLLSKHGIDGGVCFFPMGEDPASMIKEGNEEKLRTVMKKTMNIIRFSLSSIVESYDISNAHEKNRALSESVDFLKSLPSLIVSNEYKSYLSQILQINQEYITLGQVKKTVVQNYAQNENRAELCFYKTLIENPSWISEMLGILDYEAVENNPIFIALMNEDFENEVLVPLKIRDDIYIYSMDEYIKALKIKQREYLNMHLKRLSSSNDNNVFSKMSKIQKEIKGIYV